MIQLRVGNSAVLINGQVVGDANGCPRANLVRAFAGQPIVKDRRATVTFAVGIALEGIAFKWLQEQYGENIRSDVEMSEEIIDGVTMTGHCDFLLKRNDCFLPTEHKSISSADVAKKVLLDGKYKPNNLAQLCHYMLICEATEGTLLYTSATYTKGVMAGDQRAFAVKFHDTGAVTVDGENAPFLVTDLLDWRIYMAETVKRKHLDSPPKQWDGIFSPCNGCWLKETCESYDANGEDKEFWEGVEEILNREGRR